MRRPISRRPTSIWRRSTTRSRTSNCSTSTRSGWPRLDPARVNRSGGALGEGHLHEANGLARTSGAVEQLRAGAARTAVVQSWRGVPSTSAAVAVLRAAG